MSAAGGGGYWGKKGKRDEDDEDNWLVTYADAITLLLTFFITLTAISKINVPIFEEVSAGIASELGKRDVVRPIALLEESIQQVLSDLPISNDTIITKDIEGLVVEFEGPALFPDGGANLSQDGAFALSEIALTALAPRYRNYLVEINAHASAGQPVAGFGTLWRLTSMRAAVVSEAFEREGITAERIHATGRADGAQQPGPEIEGTDERGPPPSNDRLVLRIHPPIDPETGAAVVPSPSELLGVQGDGEG